MATKRAMLFFDGACRGNGTRHARAGAGYVLHVDGRCVASGHTFLGAVSNNVAEYAGLLAGMRLARALAITHLTIRGDSQTTALAPGWKEAGRCRRPLTQSAVSKKIFNSSIARRKS